jgi:hypothetical protein
MSQHRKKKQKRSDALDSIFESANEDFEIEDEEICILFVKFTPHLLSEQRPQPFITKNY